MSNVTNVKKDAVLRGFNVCVTDQPTDQRTYMTSYRCARMHIKRRNVYIWEDMLHLRNMTDVKNEEEKVLLKK